MSDEPADTPPSTADVADDLTLRGRFAALGRGMRGMVAAIDRTIPNVRTHDGLAMELARRTPRTVLLVIGLMLAGVVASRLGLWVFGALWGIPVLGALSLGLGFMLWTSNMLLWPGVSPEARGALRRALRVQLVMLLVGGACMLYFVGLAARWW